MSASGRMGLLGGTFDPIHYGHLDIADAARRHLALDGVTFIPSHDPPHRLDPHASVFHRFALVALAVAGRPGFAVSDAELTREGPSFTVDTLRRMHLEGWGPAQLFFIIGTDAFAEIATWREYPAVLDMAHFVVVTRPGTTLDAAMARVPELRARARHSHEPASHIGSTSLLLVEAATRDVSSTMVRARLQKDEAIDDLVPPAVARHIEENHLYGAVDELHG